MYCTSCGTERADDAKACGQCGQRVAYFPPPEAVPNYLVHSILVTLCCCPPFGIVALIYASQVNNKLAAGDVPGAQYASRRARIWGLVAFILGIILIVILALVAVLNK